jgi:hypothetical protein
MATTWGTTETSLACGIDVSESPSTVTSATSSVTVTWTVYAKAYYAFEDPQILTLSNALSASKSYYLSAPDYPSVTTYKIGTWTQAVTPSYTGTVSKTLVAAISNVWNGATPSHSRTVSIAQRPPADPSAPTSVNASLSGTTTAAVTWVRPSNAGSAGTIWSNVGIDVSVNGAAYVVETTLAGTATSYNDTGLLANTTYRYRIYGKNSSGISAYVYTATLQTTLPIPTAVTPAAAATVTVPNPALGGTFTTIVAATGKLEWEFAKDNVFTNDVRSVVEADADLKTVGPTTEAPTIGKLALSNGLWYMHARVINNSGQAGPWSAAQSFTVNTPALPAPTAVTPAAGANSTTMQPILGATITVDPAGRLGKAEWQLATNSGFTTGLKTVTESDVDFRASGATTETVPVEQRISMDLGTTWYVRARTIANDGSISAWTTGTSFTLTVTAPPPPTLVTPAAGGPAITTNTPTLGATLTAATENRTVKAEWQLATDSGFTTALKTVTEADTDLRTSGATTEVTPVASKLSQTTWYIRAREIDQYGQASTWTSGTTFTVSHAPTATTRIPVASSTSEYGATTVFGWTFGDASSSDTQTAYQIIVERNDTGAAVLDTGKVMSTGSTGSHAISATYKDVVLRWKIRVYDNDNVVGAYSSYSVFTLSDPPLVTITTPAEAAQVTTGQPTITWTNDASTVQVSRRVVITRTSDSVVVSDSGTTATTSLTYTTPNVVLQNGESYYVTVTVTDNVGMVGSDTNNFTAQYQAPDAVQINVDESIYDTEGYVYIDWSAVTPDGYFVDWRVYRRPPLATEWELLNVTTDADERYYRDWMAPAGSTFEYAVTQTAGRFGIIIESPIVFTETREIEGSHYWLINPYDESVNLQVSQVTDDSYTDEYEEAELQIIGRGRKMNHGTRFGYTGTLTAQLRDTEASTARSKRIALQALKAARTTYYLRNPFGDILEVSLGNLGVSRIAGVGTSELVDMTIPYNEVF